MGDQKLLIAGIDPGTTTGYAILDLDGNLIELKSSKNLGLNGLIADISKIGKVVCVGTDKARIPGLVEVFSAKTGAKILYPKEDLRIYEKRKLVSGFKTKDEHQHDALASSLLAFRKIKAILDRINEYADENKKHAVKEKITDLVLTRGISIREAADVIENSGKEETRIIKRVVEEKKLAQSDFMNLYRIIKRHEKEIYLLKKQNDNLKNHTTNLEKRHSSISRKEDNAWIDKKIQERILLKEKSISFLGKELDYRDTKIRRLLEDIKKLNNFISRVNEALILKKIDNLGSAEFNKKKNFLNIRKGDILLVDNPNIISHDVAVFLESFVDTIITKIPPSAEIRQEHDFAFVDYKKLKIEEAEFFAVVSKEEMKMALNDENALKSVIEDYKKKRNAEINPVSP